MNDSWSTLEEAIESTQRSIDRAEHLADTAVGLLASIFPGHDVTAFKNALASYLMDDAPAALASMQAESKKPTTTMNNGYGMMSMPISVETLTSLVKQRDYLQQQINTFTGALAPYKGINVMPPEAMAMLDALAETQAAPFRSQLENVEEKILEVQKQLESSPEGVIHG